ncbi:MAG TPA: hypothetical protein PLJ47_18445, partial [Candidatus Hydrogenedentes bacterium]|nr:hypothetical protein [Candidatus Hydrogenedentota bacterium]
ICLGKRARSIVGSASLIMLRFSVLFRAYAASTSVCAKKLNMLNGKTADLRAERRSAVPNIPSAAPRAGDRRWAAVRLP